MSKKKTDADRAVPKLVKITGELHAIFKRGTEDVIQIGRLLMSAKKEVGHGEFLPWLEKEFSLSEKSAQRFMAAHKFMTTVAAPLLKSDKLADLRVRPSALYELTEMHSRGTVTQADIEAVLKDAAKNWVGSKRLEEILKSRHPVETTPQATREAEPEVAGEAPGEVTGEATTGEAIDTARSTEAAGEATGGAGDGKGEQTTATPPATAPKPKSAPSAKDEGNLRGFTGNISNLKRLATGSAKKYVATALQAADLETVADFVRAVADLKKKQSAETSVSAEATAEAREAQDAGAAVSIDLAKDAESATTNIFSTASLPTDGDTLVGFQAVTK
jgi:hypothetical protein